MVPILQGGAKALYALLDIACKDLVQSEASRVVELLEEVLHEVLQQPVLVIELEEATLIGSFGVVLSSPSSLISEMMESLPTSDAFWTSVRSSRTST